MKDFFKPWMMWLIVALVLVILIPANIIIARRHKEYEGPPEVMIRRIIVYADRSNPEDDARARQEVELILKRARAGEDFAELAEEYSQIPGDKERQGLLDWATTQTLHPKVAEVAFSLEEGQISGVIPFIDAYGIIRVEDKRP